MKTNIVKIAKLIFISTVILLICEQNIVASCEANPKLQLLRSRELQKLLVKDQQERQNKSSEFWDNKKNLLKLSKKDLARRKRVGQIFAEGCLTTATDYHAAAVIFQHGETSEHFLQAYLWSKKSAELGDKNGNDMAALAIDRYLTKTKRKQLFGTQFLFKKNKLNKSCYCMQEVEPSFPENLRQTFSGHSLKERIIMLGNYYSSYEYCPEQCTENLKPTSKGTIIGLW